MNQNQLKAFGEYITAPNYNAALMDLEAGAVDAVAMDEVVAKYQNEKEAGDFLGFWMRFQLQRNMEQDSYQETQS